MYGRYVFVYWCRLPSYKKIESYEDARFRFLLSNLEFWWMWISVHTRSCVLLRASTTSQRWPTTAWVLSAVRSLWRMNLTPHQSILRVINAATLFLPVTWFPSPWTRTVGSLSVLFKAHILHPNITRKGKSYDHKCLVLLCLSNNWWVCKGWD